MTPPHPGLVAAIFEGQLENHLAVRTVLKDFRADLPDPLGETVKSRPH